MRIEALYRYPVKGLSAEPLDRLTLERRSGVPHDRCYALALGSTRFSAQAPMPLDKGHFLMLRANESLAALRTGFDPHSACLSISRGGEAVLRADLSTGAGRAAVGDFFDAYIGRQAAGPIRVVSAPGHKFTDVGVVSASMMRAVSLVNLASVRALQEAVGGVIDPLRFRANIHLDGLAAWEELRWIGRDIQIGAVALRAARVTRRCAAIDVNPVTAARDTRLPAALVRHFGHPNLGVYLEVIEDGAIARGDAVAVMS